MNWIKQQVANVAGTAEPIYGPSALRSVAEQAAATPWTALRPDDLQWAAMDSTCVETQTVYLFADSGALGLAQVIYSNVAGIRTTCQFNSKLSYPGTPRPHAWHSDALENHGFDAARRSFFADGCALDLAADGASLTVKSARNPACLVDLTVVRGAAPGFQVGRDGASSFGTDPAAPWGTMRHTFWPRCAVKGGFTTPEGTVEFQRAIFIHALQGMKPHHAAAKWNYLTFQGPTHSAVLMEFTTPPSYGSSVVSVGGVVTDTEVVCAGASNKVTHTATLKDDPDWPAPSAARFEWQGATGSGEKVEAVVEGELGAPMDKVDVMAEVPGFVKTIVGGVVGTRPFIYQYYPQPELELQLKVGEKEIREKGKILMESTFISE